MLHVTVRWSVLLAVSSLLLGSVTGGPLVSADDTPPPAVTCVPADDDAEALVCTPLTPIVEVLPLGPQRAPAAVPIRLAPPVSCSSAPSEPGVQSCALGTGPSVEVQPLGPRAAGAPPPVTINLAPPATCAGASADAVERTCAVPAPITEVLPLGPLPSGAATRGTVINLAPPVTCEGASADRVAPTCAVAPPVTEVLPLGPVPAPRMMPRAETLSATRGVAAPPPVGPSVLAAPATAAPPAAAAPVTAAPPAAPRATVPEPLPQALPRTGGGGSLLGSDGQTGGTQVIALIALTLLAGAVSLRVRRRRGATI